MLNNGHLRLAIGMRVAGSNTLVLHRATTRSLARVPGLFTRDEVGLRLKALAPVGILVFQKHAVRLLAVCRMCHVSCQTFRLPSLLPR